MVRIIVVEIGKYGWGLEGEYFENRIIIIFFVQSCMQGVRK